MQSAATCEKCGDILIPLRSLYIKKCVSCGKEYEWPLKPNQKPLQ